MANIKLAHMLQEGWQQVLNSQHTKKALEFFDQKLSLPNADPLDTLFSKQVWWVGGGGCSFGALMTKHTHTKETFGAHSDVIFICAVLGEREWKDANHFRAVCTNLISVFFSFWEKKKVFFVSEWPLLRVCSVGFMIDVAVELLQSRLLALWLLRF